MKFTRSSVAAFLFVLLLIGMFLGGCVVKDSPAPGCVRRVGPAPMGGCAGKQIIEDVRLVPEIECLSVMPNNCNGGVLEVDNRCDGQVSLGGVTIAAGEHTSLDVRREGGEYRLVVSAGNISGYLPDSDERVSVEGSVNGRNFRLEFVKTGPLCP